MMRPNDTPEMVERQRAWARWYEQARKTYEEEMRKRGREIDWRELPLNGR